MIQVSQILKANPNKNYFLALLLFLFFHSFIYAIGPIMVPKSDDIIKKFYQEVWLRRSQKLHEKYPPTKGIALENRVFYFSTIYRDSTARLYVVMYTRNQDGDTLARLFYKSRSDGPWRFSPYYRMPHHKLSKGTGVHYTQETKVHEFILKYLERIQKLQRKIPKDNCLVELFSFSDTVGFAILEIFREEVKQAKLSENTLKQLMVLQSCMPGLCFGGEKVTGSQQIKDMREKLFLLPMEVNLALQNKHLTGFVPDFSKMPLRKRVFRHIMLGYVEILVFKGVLEGRNIEWHMAYDKPGRVWIDRISYEDEKITSYGVPHEFINTGVLTNKPLEYYSQAWKLFSIFYEPNKSGARDFEHRKNIGKGDYKYVDITPFLDQLDPIKAFRAARKIYRNDF